MLTPAVKKLDCAVRVVTPENIEFEYALAGPFQRLPAFLFDIVVRITAYVLLVALIGFLFSWVSLGILAVGVAASLLYFFMSWFYGAYFESQFNGRTLGKMVFRLRVISVDGRPINAVQAALRNLLRLADMGVFVSLQALDAEVPAFIIPVFSIGLVTMMFTGRYQRLGDLAAGTMVISEHVQRTAWNIQPDDVRAFGLAELIPANFPISNSLAKTVGMYMENRQRLYPGRRMEVAKNLADPLIRRFELMPDTSADLLLCALYVRIYFSEEQRMAGLEEMRRRPGMVARSASPTATLSASPPATLGPLGMPPATLTPVAESPVAESPVAESPVAESPVVEPQADQCSEQSAEQRSVPEEPPAIAAELIEEEVPGNAQVGEQRRAPEGGPQA